MIRIFFHKIVFQISDIFNIRVFKAVSPEMMCQNSQQGAIRYTQTPGRSWASKSWYLKDWHASATYLQNRNMKLCMKSFMLFLPL